jgi:hypothetical protein
MVERFADNAFLYGTVLTSRFLKAASIELRLRQRVYGYAVFRQI